MLCVRVRALNVEQPAAPSLPLSINMPVREQLTVIITTSAIRSHPSMEMIARVRASFGLIEVPLPQQRHAACR